jgi:hypothetical protein
MVEMKQNKFMNNFVIKSNVYPPYSLTAGLLSKFLLISVGQPGLIKDNLSFLGDSSRIIN